MENLKFRCSSLSDVANGKQGLTSAQERDLNELLSKVKLTEKQAEKRDELIAKRDAPVTLTQTGISKVENIVKQLIYDYEIQLDNKYVNKGLRMEENAIRFLSMVTGKSYEKNEKFFQNDFICGTPDIIDGNKIIDIKCSWSKATFPLFEEEAHNVTYEYQMRGYMMLTGCESADVIYCLMSTPIDLISSLKNNGERTFYESMDLHNMEDLDPRLRFTKITYHRDLEIEKQIIEKCKVAKDYANEFYNKVLFRMI
jgi:hypothetical protein